MADSHTREFLAERDARIMKMRSSGTPVGEIARRFTMTPAAVNAAVRRQLEKLNREALLAYPEVLRLELERLDSLQAALWPLTQHRRVQLPDGTEMTVEPDTKAVTTVLGIMDRRAKLLGMDATQVNLSVHTTEPQRAVLAGAEDGPAAVDAFDPETEARALLKVMHKAGVLDEATIAELVGAMPLDDPLELEDADLVDDDDNPTAAEAMPEPPVTPEIL